MMVTPAVQTDQYFEAQTGVLGSLLLDAPSCAGEIFQRTRPEHYTEAYRTLFEAARTLYQQGQPIDPVTVRGLVGEEYTQMLVQLMDLTPTAVNYRAYVDLLLDRAQLNKLQAAGLALAGCQTTEEARQVVEQANQAMIQKTTARTVGAREGFLDFLERVEQAPAFIPWGLEKLDKAVLSAKGDFVVIGGRPSAGKTALSLQFAWEQAKDRKVGYFSLETNPEKIYDRLVTLASGVPFGRVKNRDLGQEDYDRIASVGTAFEQRQLEVIHAVGMTVSELQAVTANRGYDIVYIDYLQFLQSEGPRSDDLYRQVTKVSMDLHAMAGAMGVLVVALSQLSRPARDEQGKAPGLSSLRESGQIEQDADAVLLLYKTDGKDPDSPRRLHIAKNKEGRTGGYLDMIFDGALQRFREAPEVSSPATHYSAVGRKAKQAARAGGAEQVALDLDLKMAPITAPDPSLPF